MGREFLIAHSERTAPPNVASLFSTQLVIDLDYIISNVAQKRLLPIYKSLSLSLFFSFSFSFNSIISASGSSCQRLLIFRRALASAAQPGNPAKWFHSRDTK